MSLLDHYYKLSSDNPDERIDAAESLLRGLEAKNSDEDWTYALKRLVRGLSSSKGSARLGFSMALAELLQLRVRQVSIKQYLTLVEQTFVVSASMKGNEERGLLLGKLFALEILGKSPLWDANSSGSDDLKRFVEMLMSLSLKKSWLREPPFFALVELVKRLGNSPEYVQGFEWMFSHLYEQGLAPTCEGVALFLAVSPEQRVALNQGKDHGWKGSDPMIAENLSTLRRVLRDMPVMSGDVSTNKPYIHFLWSMLLKEFCHKNEQQQQQEPMKKKRKTSTTSPARSAYIDLSTFWSGVVDKDFFSSDASNERKMWGLEIFLMWAQCEELPEVVPLFSANFIKVLGLQLAVKERNLFRISKRIAQLITTKIAQTRPHEIVSILAKFMSFSPNFDKTSKSKLVSELLSQVKTKDQTKELVKLLLDLLETGGDTVKTQWVFDNLVNLVKNVDGDEWIGDILWALIPLAYFVNSEEGVSKMAQDRIMSILSSTLSKGPQNDWPFRVFQMISEFKQKHPEKEPLVEFDDETSKAKTRAEHTLTKIHNKRQSSRHVDSPQLRAFELLFSMVLLQLYGSAGDAVSMLDELLMCYHKINLDEEGEDASMALTEILISLMSQQSVVLRKLSEDVWKTFADYFTSGCLALICDILAAQEGVQGQRSLFEVEDEDGADDEDDDDEDEEEEIEEDNLDDDDEDDYELDTDSKAKLAGALGVKDLSDEDADDDDESSMDDEQMSALDVHLGAIFRERRKQQEKAHEARSENRKAKQNIVQLKGRMLDLLELYVQVQPANLLGLDIIEPLLQLIQNTKERRLAEKAREILKSRVCRKTNYVLTSEAELMRCLDMIKAVQAMAATSKLNVLSLACNQVSVFLSKLVISFDAELVSAVSSIYSSSLQQWFLQGTKNQTMTNMFIDFVNFLDTKRRSSDEK